MTAPAEAQATPAAAPTGAELEQVLSRPIPADWTVSKALDTYLAVNGFTRAEYDRPWVEVTFWSFTFPFPNPPSRRQAIRMHDLHHVVTGYGTSPTGEAEISAWELRRGVGVFSLFVQGIILGGVLLGLLHAPSRTLAAWRAGRSPSGAGLHPCDPELYASLLGRSVGELRALYDVPKAGITGARELHYAAPSRQG